MIVGIHQPEHLPWQGWFRKYAQSDVFVVLDNAQYRKNYFHHRNKIKRGTDGWQWQTVPVAGRQFPSALNTTAVAATFSVERYMARLYQEYGRHPYAALLQEMPVFFSSAIIGEVNLALIRWLLRVVGLGTEKLVLASSFAGEVTSCGSRRVADLVRLVGGTVYLAGPSAPNYLELTDFTGIRLKLFDSSPHPYQPVIGTYVTGLSFIDAVMNFGMEAQDVL